jgi:DNA ligase (NAD+)
VSEFLFAPANRAVIDKLRRAGVSLSEPGIPAGGLLSVAAADGAAAVVGGVAGAGTTATGPDGAALTLEGRSVVVTGTVEGYTREEAEAAILARGGKSPGSVSAKTFAVVLGSDPGAAKLKKAEELGIPVVDGSDFEALLETGDLPER